MDFIEALPLIQGKSVIFVVVDRLSKYAHFGALGHPYSVRTVADLFVQIFVKHHGYPNQIISDRDKVFTSLFWQELYKLQGVEIKLSSSYHPQTDGQTEVVNRCLEQYLRCFAGESPKQWLQFLPWAEFSYNTAYHSSAKTSPYELRPTTSHGHSTLATLYFS